MTFKLRPLPYAKNALAPSISERTMEFHYEKHHGGYVNKLNAALEGKDLGKSDSLEEIIHKSYKDESAKGVFNNAAQVWNHDFFWRSMAPNGGGEPGGKLGDAIKSTFGSYDQFCSSFVEKAGAQFGSGWAWLVNDLGKLKIVTTPNAVTPIVEGQSPLMTCDVWEHAYYLDYQNDRPGFVKTFLDKLVNWEFAAERFSQQGDGDEGGQRRFREQEEKYAHAG